MEGSEETGDGVVLLSYCSEAYLENFSYVLLLQSKSDQRLMIIMVLNEFEIVHLEVGSFLVATPAHSLVG